MDIDSTNDMNKMMVVLNKLKKELNMEELKLANAISDETADLDKMTDSSIIQYAMGKVIPVVIMKQLQNQIDIFKDKSHNPSKYNDAERNKASTILGSLLIIQDEFKKIVDTL